MKWSIKKTQHLKPSEDIIGEVHTFEKTFEKMIWRERVEVIVDLENESLQLLLQWHAVQDKF
jgi:hypothetical protein